MNLHRPAPTLPPIDSKSDDVLISDLPNHEVVESTRREERDAREAIDDLANRVTQLEAAQFIRGRL